MDGGVPSRRAPAHEGIRRGILASGRLVGLNGAALIE